MAAATRARRRHTAAIPFPELPSRGPHNEAQFWRAAWLRDLAQLHAMKALIAQKTFQRMTPPLRTAILSGEVHLRDEVNKSLQYLIEAGGLLYAWVPEGGAE